MSNDNIAKDVTLKVASFIKENTLLDKDRKQVVALSGGADSVALLLLLHGLGYDVDAAHCNFHLRGDESVRDEEFCVSLCRKCGVELHRIHFDTREYASLHKVSIEMAARDLRYSYFRQLCRDLDAQSVCVAHHRDDNVETILLNIIRGTGLNGLTGMAPRNGLVVRPLLCVDRSEIEQYLAALGQDFVTDSTNLVADVQRNKIRLNVIPMLEDVNPAVKTNILNMARWMAEAQRVVDASVSSAAGCMEWNDGQAIISISLLRSFPSVEYYLWNILSAYGFNSAQVAQVSQSLDGEPGRTWLSATHELCLDRGRLLLSEKSGEAIRPMTIPEPGLYVCPFGARIRVSSSVINSDYAISRDRCHACLDADKVVFPLTVRGVEPGDRFVPFGMKGSKLLSDFLTGLKMPLTAKRRQLVVTDASGKIVWVVGCRPDARFCLTDRSRAVTEISLLS